MYTISATSAYKITVERVGTKQPDSNAQSKVYLSGDIAEVQTIDKLPPSLRRYRRLDKAHMLDTHTGELIPCKPSESRLDSKRSLTSSMTALKRLINSNFAGDNSELHVTLTYGSLMTDTKKLYHDFRLFWSKLKYRYPSLEYIAVAEPQRTGSWHFHLLLKDVRNGYLFVPNDVIYSLWGHGFTTTVRLPATTNFGVYFTARLVNDDLLEDDTEHSDSKYIVKGGRLKYYPARFRFYRASKGIKRPTILSMSYGEAKQLVGNGSPLYGATKNIVRINPDGTRTVVNSITYQEIQLKK